MSSELFSNNIAVVQKAKSASVVILTPGRIPRKELARNICEMFHFVQHDKRGFGQQLYYCLKKNKDAPRWAHPYIAYRS